MTVPEAVFLPPENDRTQLAVERVDPSTRVDVVNGARAVKQVIVIRKDLRMRRGKEIAQGAHAAMAWLSRRLIHDISSNNAIAQFSDPERFWLMNDFRKVTLQVSTEEELMDVHDRAEAAGLEVNLITDAGFTEFHGTPTVTCLAIGPDYDDKIDPITQGLSLY